MTMHNDFWRCCDRLIRIVDGLLKTTNIDRTPFELDAALDEILHPPSGIEGIDTLWEELRRSRQTAIDFQHGRESARTSGTVDPFAVAPRGGKLRSQTIP